MVSLPDLSQRRQGATRFAKNPKARFPRRGLTRAPSPDHLFLVTWHKGKITLAKKTKSGGETSKRGVLQMGAPGEPPRAEARDLAPSPPSLSARAAAASAHHAMHERTFLYDQQVYQRQLPIVKYFIYHLIYYRALRRAYGERQLQDEFWALTTDAHLLRAAINWCMIFGSDKHEPTHWKKLSIAASQELKKSFDDGLFKETGFNRDSWRAYWRSMTDFRNKYAVHRELTPITKPVPDFDGALEVAFFFDRWTREVISPDEVAEPPLERFAQTLSKSIVPLVEKLLGATEELRQQ